MAVAPPPKEAFQALYETARAQLADTADKAANLDRNGTPLARYPCRNADPVGLGWAILGGAVLLLTKTDDIAPQITPQGIREPFLDGWAAGLLLVAGVGSRYIDGAFPAAGSPEPPLAPAECASVRRSLTENAARSVSLFLRPVAGQADMPAYARGSGAWRDRGAREELAAALPGLDLAAAGWALLVIGGQEMRRGSAEGVRTRQPQDSLLRAGEGIVGALLVLAGDACLG